MTETDPSALRPANDNPWYRLASLHGEQPIGRLDKELAEKNRSAWNKWFGDVTEGQRQEFINSFTMRTGKWEKPPEPTARIDFSRTHFEQAVDFRCYSFPRRADFDAATFSDSASFDGANFSDVANFEMANFKKVATFRSTHLTKANFRSATFSETASFRSATFPGFADFHEVKFGGVATFHSATFSRANFRKVIFSELANFHSANFSGSASFGSATFLKSANFRSASFSDTANFRAGTFAGEIDFINASFGAQTGFADASFASLVPDFRGAKMHEATEWHGVTWPKPPLSEPEAQEQVYAYERLKQEMERLKKHEDEQIFFRRELRARRGLVRSWSSAGMLNLIYQISSDYGDSFSKPLLWLVGVFAAGIAIFTQVPLCAGQPMPLKLAARLSFANIFVFLNDKRELVAMPDMAACLSNTTAAVSATQSVSGVVLLFLIGLALRNRFRMK